MATKSSTRKIAATPAKATRTRQHRAPAPGRPAAASEAAKAARDALERAIRNFNNLPDADRRAMVPSFDLPMGKICDVCGTSYNPALDGCPVCLERRITFPRLHAWPSATGSPSGPRPFSATERASWEAVGEAWGVAAQELRRVCERNHKTMVDVLLALGFLTEDDLRLQSQLESLQFSFALWGARKEHLRLQKCTEHRELLEKYRPALLARIVAEGQQTPTRQRRAARKES